MELTLEMVDGLRSRAGVSFGEAVIALEKTEGDVVKALLLLEGEGTGSLHTASTEDICAAKDSKDGKEKSRVSRMMAKTGKLSFKIKRGEHTFTEVPLALALGTTFLFPKVWAWMSLGLLATSFSLIGGDDHR